MRKVELGVLWLLLAAPGAFLIWRYATGAMGYGSFVTWSGDIAVWLLIVALAVTPLRTLFSGAWTLFFVRRRRDFGVASFAYACGHLVVYLLRKADVDLVLDEALGLGMLAGWLAFFVFAPLAVTSNNFSVRLLKGGWRKLHWLVYPAAALTMAHWFLTAFEPTMAIVHAVIIGVLLGLRAAPDWSKEDGGLDDETSGEDE